MKHNDPFPHIHKEQLKCGTWYIHGSGIDITFGDENRNIHGGILLRAVTLASNTDIEKNKANDTYGPLKLRALIGDKLSTLWEKYHGRECTKSIWVSTES